MFPLIGIFFFFFGECIVLVKERKRRENAEARGEREKEWVREHREEGKREQVRELKILFFSFGNEWCSLDVACYLSFLNLSGSLRRLICESFRVFGNIFSLKLVWLD